MAFAYLVLERQRSVSRSDLAEVVWPRKLPRAWDGALNSIVSKIRTLLLKTGLKKDHSISSAMGCYQLCLPPRAWIDIESAADHIHEAESLLKAHDHRKAWSAAQVAYHVSRRPFVPSEEGPWIDSQREGLRTVFARSCECLAEIYIWNNEPTTAIEVAKEVVTLHPYRESAYRLLMKAHASAGNRAEALWVFERCRKLLATELGVNPSAETRAVHLQILKSS